MAGISCWARRASLSRVSKPLSLVSTMVEAPRVETSIWSLSLVRSSQSVPSTVWVPAGVARMKLLPFHLYTFIGSWPFCFALAWVGRELGEQWNSDPRLKAAFHQAHIVIGVLGAAAVAFYIWHRVRGLKRHG